MDVRKAAVHLSTVIDGDEMHHDYVGEYQMKNGSHCVAYTDYMGNGITMVGIEASGSAMLLHRVGSVTADMLFDPSMKTVVHYDALSLKGEFVLHTLSYFLAELDSGLMIQTEYDLSEAASGEHITHGRQILFISFPEDTPA